MKKILSLLFLCTLLFVHNKVSYANDDIIIDYIHPDLKIEIIDSESSPEIANEFPRFPQLYGIYRPVLNWDISSGAYTFSVHTENSIIFSNYYFKGHNGTLKFKLPETSGPSSAYYKFYLYEQATYQVVAELSLRKNTTSSFSVTNLNTSKGYHFGIRPNNDLTTIVNGQVWK